jgi:hypothetical protein
MVVLRYTRGRFSSASGKIGALIDGVLSFGIPFVDRA